MVDPRPFRFPCCRLVLLCCLLTCAPAWAAVCRVTTAGVQNNDGSSWASSMILQLALFAPTCTEIWVAKGVYKPNSYNQVSFAIPDGVALYGGFAGGESACDQRNPTANLTVLSGDADNNDSTDADGVDVDTTHIVGSNSPHVVTMTDVGAGTVLDGFTVTGGNATASNGGGGLHCDGTGLGNRCDPTLSHLAFRGNRASASSGGAIFNHGNSNPVINDVTFSGNSATSSGGAIYNEGNGLGTSSPVLSNVTFSGNSAQTGGAIACVVTGIGGVTSPTLVNATFAGNSATGAGGAIYNSAGPGASVVSLSNAILWGNLAPAGQGPEIRRANYATAVIDHSVIKGSGGSGGGWDTNLGTDGGGNLDADPLLGALMDNGGPTQTMLPDVAGPAIDNGNDTGCPAEDQRGVARPQGLQCDIGAVELVLDRVFANNFDGRPTP